MNNRSKLAYERFSKEFDSRYPGWRKDKKTIKRLKQAAKIAGKNDKS